MGSRQGFRKLREEMRQSAPGVLGKVNPGQYPDHASEDSDADDDLQRPEDLVGQPAPCSRGPLGEDAPVPDGQGSADHTP